MQSVLRHLVASLLVVLLSTTAMAQDQLVIEGTGDSQQLLRQLAKAFEAVHPGTRIIVPDSIGSSGGVKALSKGKCDLARVARPLKDKEKALAPDLSYRQFAYSPVVFVANLPERCVDNLTTEELVGIYSGAITDWSALGTCRPHKIYVANRESGDSSRSVLEKNIPEFKAIPQLAGKVVYSTPETAQIIEDHPFTVGYLPQAAASPNLLQFAFNGADSSDESILDNSYRLVSPFGLVWKGELSGLAAKFLDFVISSQGSRVIRSAGGVPSAGQ